MHESWSTGKLSQEVRTQKRNQSLDRGHLSSQGPTQPSIPQADPAPFRPADPAATELVTEVSFLSSRTQTHFPGAPASWLSSGVSRTAGGGGFKLRSWLVPTGPVAVHSDPTLLPGHPLPTPGLQSSGDQPYLLHSLGPSAPPAFGPPRPLPPRAPRRRRGQIAEREEGLEEGGFRFRSHLHLGPRG